MTSSPSHRATQSVSRNLQTPGQGSTDSLKQQRRMTSPAGSLALPDGGRRPSPRPPSPLRNGFIMDSSTGIDPHGADDESDEDEDDDDDDPAKWQRSPSPASSVSHLAASFVQRMNNFVGGIGPKSPTMLSDAELEAEAERERDHSRREAEAILTREAQQRKLVEERVLAMVESAKSLPPPPSLSQSSPNPPSPSNSQKETNWWTAAKQRLTPSKEKEPLTPAQQVIQDAKAREKEKKSGKGKEKEWPTNAQRKFSDPAFANLNIPVAPPQRKPVPAAQPSPPTTPSRPSLSNLPPNLTPSPMRSIDNISTSPSREAPPLYAQFNPQGALDVPGTLLTIAKRFEKLEKWTVGHVRALEERMNDVEKWLVDKEKEKAESIKEQPATSGPAVNRELSEIKEEIVELQGRVGELGREMAKLATAPARLLSGPTTQTTTISPAPQTTSSSLVEQHTGSSLSGTPHRRRMSSTALSDSTSPPLASNKTPSGTRLPYPQGDYTSPPDAFSPPNSPPGSINAARRTQALSISGLPSSGPYSATSMSYSTTSLSSATSYGRTMSPAPMSANPAATAARALSPTPSGNGSSSGLPPPKQTNQRQSSVSPTPRKRYTVALGGPIVAPDELSSNAADTPPPAKRKGTPKSFIKSANSLLTSETEDDDDEEDNEFGGETIGKSAAARMASSTGAGTGGPGKGDYKAAASSSPSPMSSRRLRAQSAYGFSTIPGAAGTTAAEVLAAPSVAPLRTRAKSSERLNSGGIHHQGTGDGMVSSLGIGSAKFVDPLVLRKQSQDALTKPIAMPKPRGKVPIGQLVAFFDKEKK